MQEKYILRETHAKENNAFKSVIEILEQQRFVLNYNNTLIKLLL